MSGTDKMLDSINKNLKSVVGEETAKDIMSNMFDSFEESDNAEKIPKGKIITAEEFLAYADTDMIIIHTKKDGNDRCTCLSPVRNVEWDNDRGCLNWSDSMGDPECSGVTLESELREIGDGRYDTTCYLRADK